MNNAVWNPKRFVRNLVSACQRNAVKNVSNLPSMDDFPMHACKTVPHLRILYEEVYSLTLLGFYNASIVMQGVLLERLVKEIIYSKEEKEFQKPLGSAVRRCAKKGYLEANEVQFLNLFRTIRNKYQHFDLKGLTNGKSHSGWSIPIDNSDLKGSIIKALKAIEQGRAGPKTRFTYGRVRHIMYIDKYFNDARLCFQLFRSVDNFFRDMIQKYLPVTNMPA